MNYEKNTWLTQDLRAGTKTLPLQGKGGRANKGIKIFVYIKTMAASSDLTVTLYGVNAPAHPNGGWNNAYPILAKNFTAATTTVFPMTVYPSLVAVTNQVVNDILPQNFYIEVTSKDSGLNEYSVTYDLIP